MVEKIDSRIKKPDGNSIEFIDWDITGERFVVLAVDDIALDDAFFQNVPTVKKRTGAVFYRNREEREILVYDRSGDKHPSKSERIKANAGVLVNIGQINWSALAEVADTPEKGDAVLRNQRAIFEQDLEALVRSPDAKLVFSVLVQACLDQYSPGWIRGYFDGSPELVVNDFGEPTLAGHKVVPENIIHILPPSYLASAEELEITVAPLGRSHPEQFQSHVVSVNGYFALPKLEEDFFFLRPGDAIKVDKRSDKTRIYKVSSEALIKTHGLSADENEHTFYRQAVAETPFLPASSIVEAVILDRHYFARAQELARTELRDMEFKETKIQEAYQRAIEVVRRDD